MDEDIERLLAELSDDEGPTTATNVTAGNSRLADVQDEGALLENELASCLQTLQKLYEPRAPKLASITELRADAAAFARTVLVLGNAPDVSRPSAGTQADPLVSTVGSARALAIRLALAEDAGSPLEPSEWDAVESLARQIGALKARQREALDAAAADLPSRAPNVARILDAHVAARLLARLGSVRALALSNPANLASVRASPLLEDPLVAEVPAQFKRQALRIVAAKVVLAARVDATSHTGSGEQGARWRREVNDRLDKLLAPPLSLQHRALPKPVDRKIARRGGKRVRKQKKKHVPSDLAQAENILRFGS